jgi:hypothetical protein
VESRGAALKTSRMTDNEQATTSPTFVIQFCSLRSIQNPMLQSQKQTAYRPNKAEDLP